MGDPARFPKWLSGEPNPGKRSGNHQHHQGNGGHMTLHPAPPRRNRATTMLSATFYEGTGFTRCKKLRFASGYSLIGAKLCQAKGSRVPKW